MSIADMAARARHAAWQCPKCNRTFSRTRQPHSCRTVSLDDHLRQDGPRSLFARLVAEVTSDVGKCDVLSLPCCIHLVGRYDFLAVLPKKDRLEVRFVLERELTDPRVKRSVPVSKKLFKHCVDIETAEDIDEVMLEWIREAYHLR